MNNVIEFPEAVGSHIGAAYLLDPVQHSHAVQFYDDDGFLFDTVGQFIGAGLRAGDRLIVIATAPHRDGFLRRLDEADVRQAVESGQLMLLDARQTLAKFMVGDMPDPDLFCDLIANLMGIARNEGGDRVRVRAYGEMVDVLWKDGNSGAAIRLEELWNEAGNEHSFSLLCAYLMGNFYREGDHARFLEVCRSHSHVIPTEKFARVDDAGARLREISLLQQRARALENEILHRKELEGALRDALRQRSRAEDELRAALRREKEARAQAEASDAFKEVFIGILGHDLRNPLNTILTTARLMNIRRELPPETAKRFERVISSGIRMERMIDQLLDVTRARLAAGIPVEPKEQDLVALVSKIVDEIRLAHPTRTLEFAASGRCDANVDGDRFEQVVSNLLGNAITHGDGLKRVRVEVAARGAVAHISVHNHGPAIDPAFMPLLFDPFKREKPQARSNGLGLGLYISERIVAAHGGTIAVESSDETGTLFEVTVPRKR